MYLDPVALQASADLAGRDLRRSVVVARLTCCRFVHSVSLFVLKMNFQQLANFKKFE